LLAAGGAVLAIALVAVALLAFDPPLLARLSRNLPGAATVEICRPSIGCPSSCTNQKPPTVCGSQCVLRADGDCQNKDLTYVLFTAQLALVDASLERCDLTSSALAGSLIGTKLMGATLTGANLTDADLTDADLTGADTTDTTWINVKFCNTTMPDGTINNSGCR
jgi:hypothetical protein